MLSALLLAAGQSTRMGTQKLLLSFSGRTVVSHIVHQLLNSRIDQTWVVTGHDQAEIHRALEDQPVSFVHNPNYAQSMLSSVRCGIRALPQTCEGCLVVLGDQPSLTSSLLNELIEAFHATPHGLLVPCFEGKRGHPLLVAACYFEEILAQYDDVGLRGLLHAHADQVCEYPVPDNHVLLDMDYPGDYLREIQRLHQERTEN